MKITYDKTADAAYIYLVDIEPGDVAKTQPVPILNLDFNAEGKLIGMEVLDASKNLPKDILQNSKLGFSQEELRILSQALNEILNGPEAIDDREFHARMGTTRDEAKKLLDKLQ